MMLAKIRPYTTYMNQLIKQVNQIYFYSQKLASCYSYPYSAQCKSKSRHLGGWEGSVHFVSLNLISTKQPSNECADLR